MVLRTAYTLSTRILPPEYYVHALVTGVAGIVTYAFAQGRTTNRERDLHARTILVTGAFTPLGLTLINSLASRGAHIIALSDYALDHPLPSLLIPLLRTTTNNEKIYAEYADLSSPESIREFCTKFLTGEDHRLDAIIFTHEYRTIGSLLKKIAPSGLEERETSSLATFLIVTLLLPKLLVAPIERDIRVVNVVNPFYAASAPLFTNKLTSILTSSVTPSQLKSNALFLEEGFRSLRTVVFTRHLQRVLNALPNGAPAPDGSKNKQSQAQAQAANKPNVSNIIAVSAAPGITRVETVSPLLSAEREIPESFTIFGLIIYIFLYPLLLLFTKSSKSAQQTILHALFLPTPFKRALAQLDAATDPSSAPANSKSKSGSGGDVVAEAWDDNLPEEVLKPGALYRECAVVKVEVPSLPPAPPSKMPVESESKKQKAKEKEEFVVIEDDGEFGGESLGRMVWEWYETRLKEWEGKEKATREKQKPEIPQQEEKKPQAGQPLPS